MKFHAFAFFALAAVAGVAGAEPYQSASEAHPYICNDGATAYEAWKAKLASPQGAPGFLQSGACREIAQGTKLRVLERRQDGPAFYYRVEVIGEPQHDVPQFIGGHLNPLVDPEEQARQAELAKLPIGCTTPSGGEVRRLERGKDGQIIIKRFMVISKCVNGEMRSFSTPID